MAEEQGDVPLSAAQRSRIRRLSQPKEPDPGEEAGELNVVPYLDIITNILMFVLASVSVTFISSIDTTTPSTGGGKVRQEIESRALNLSVWVTTQGISLKTSGGNVATGCADVGSGITVPLKGGAYDYAALTDCARRLKNLREEFKSETQVSITANPGTDYQTIIRVVDALRGEGSETLFNDVHFGVAR